MKRTLDVAVVGAGIVGLSHAWMAARRGLSVGVFERTPAAEGATVRNFGMVWPVGQPVGAARELALRARELWREIDSAGAVKVETCGSLHVAFREDELAVIQEYCHTVDSSCQMISPEEVLSRSELVNPTGLLGGMWSASECRVDPRTAAAKIAAWLEREYGVEFHFGTPIRSVENGLVQATSGDQWLAGHTLICSGSDLKSLYPNVFAESGLRLCKLQMFKTNQLRTQADAPHIASGLTLRHYTSFEDCASLSSLKERVANETPELDEFGIHVMASHFASGDVILGDSHEYDIAIRPFDNPQIDAWMIRELRKILKLQNWDVTERWHGIYAKHSRLPVFQAAASDNVDVFVGAGGAGMTLSFGLAEQYWLAKHDSVIANKVG